MNVHASVVVEGDVEIPWDVEIGPFCVLIGPLRIGRGARIGSHVVLGASAEHRRAESIGVVHIGEGAIIREFSVVQRGTMRDTRVGDRCLLMDRTHVAHDCVLDSDVTISPGVVLEGHTRVHRGATVGIGVMTHQHTTIGAYSMIGMGSVLTRDVPPGMIVAGNPARYVGANIRGLEVADTHGADMDAWDERFHVERVQTRGVIDKA